MDELQTISEPLQAWTVDGSSTPREGTTMNRERSKGIRSSISYASSPTSALRSPAQIEGREWQGQVSQHGHSTGRVEMEAGPSRERRNMGLRFGDVKQETDSATPRTRRDAEARTGEGTGTNQAKGITLTEKSVLESIYLLLERELIE
jgi:hypothetical protein